MEQFTLTIKTSVILRLLEIVRKLLCVGVFFLSFCKLYFPYRFLQIKIALSGTYSESNPASKLHLK